MCTLGIKASNLTSMLLLEVIDEGKLKKQFQEFGQSGGKCETRVKGAYKNGVKQEGIILNYHLS
jgi:hypothetical protein